MILILIPIIGFIVSGFFIWSAVKFGLSDIEHLYLCVIPMLAGIFIYFIAPSVIAWSNESANPQIVNYNIPNCPSDRLTHYEYRVDWTDNETVIEHQLVAHNWTNIRNEWRGYSDSFFGHPNEYILGDCIL